MSFDGIVLYGIIHELQQSLLDGRISRIYQPSKNELVLFIIHNRREHKLIVSADSINCRIHLSDTVNQNPSSPPMFCMLLRKHLLGGKIISILQKGLERIVEIAITNTDEFMQPKDYKLIVEIMGKHSNIIQTDFQNTIIDSVKRIGLELNRYREILPGKTYSDPPLDEKINLLSVDDDCIISMLKEASASQFTTTLSRWIIDNFAGFSGVSAQELALRARLDHRIPICQLNNRQIEQIAKVFSNLREDLLQCHFLPRVYCNINTKEPVDFWLFPMEKYNQKEYKSSNSVNEAADFFYSKKEEFVAVKTLRQSLKAEVLKHEKKLRQKLQYLKERIDNTSDLNKYKLWGELLSANLYRIKAGQSQVKLPNFYNLNEEVTIPLNEKLSPSHNAQLYFKMYKKLQATKKYVEARIKDTLMEMEYLESTLVNIEHSRSIQDLTEIQQELELQKYIKTNVPKGKMESKKELSKPLRFKSSDGNVIYVGKNNRQNDMLTFKKSKPDDIWLHAKNTPGSHVIVETQGHAASDTTLTEAAILAAYFSKGRNSSNVPVDYTLVRHVKKPSGAKPGFVIYFNQKTLYVTPDEKTVDKLSF